MQPSDTSRLTLLAYGLPGLPIGALGVPLYIFLPTFYSAEIGLPLTAVGAVLLLARLWDVATDPLIGTLSDRTGGRFGRRRPWLVAGVPVVVVACWMLFRPGADVGAVHLAAWSLALYLGWTMIQLPHSAWGAELSDDYHERARIAGAREVCVVLGTLAAAAMPTLLGVDGDAQPGEVLHTLAPLLAIALPLMVLIAINRVPDRRHSSSPDLRWRESGRLLLDNRPFRRLIMAYLLNGIANGLPATLFLLFVQFVLVEPERQGGLLFVYFLFGVLGVPAWLALARRFGKHRVWSIAMLANCLVFVWVPLLGAGDVLPFLVICILSGFCLGADLTLPSAIQADVVDVDTAAGGGRRTGLYFAFWGMATKLALALAVGTAFPLLDLAGFSASGGNTSPALLALALLYGLAPVVFKIAAITLMWRFPLDEATQSDLRTRIARMQIQN